MLLSRCIGISVVRLISVGFVCGFWDALWSQIFLSIIPLSLSVHGLPQLPIAGRLSARLSLTATCCGGGRVWLKAEVKMNRSVMTLSCYNLSQSWEKSNEMAAILAIGFMTWMKRGLLTEMNDGVSHSVCSKRKLLDPSSNFYSLQESPRFSL